MDTPPKTLSDVGIESSSVDSTKLVTILRIKRKRHEEPLEALLLQANNDAFRNKKRHRKEGSFSSITDSVLSVSATRLPTIFRLAETVEEKSFRNVAEAQKLKERIARRLQPGSRPITPETTEDRKDRLMQENLNNVRQARYRVINQNRARSSLPPEVRGSSEKAVEDLFQMYEAVREDADDKQPKLFPDEDLDDQDDIMCNFIPMVKEYLSLNEKTQESDEDDYVYDVYYRDDSNTQSGINTGNIGSLVWFDEETEYMNDDESDSEPGDYGDEDSNAEDYYLNDYPDEESEEDFDEQYDYELSSDDDEEYY